MWNNSCARNELAQDSYHHGKLKDALVDAASRQIADKGAASLNLRALARGLGVTHPAVYRHFADKDALLEAVAQRGFESLADVLYEAKGEGLESQLRSRADAYLSFALANPELLRVMFALIPAERREQNEVLYTASKRAYAALLDIVAEVEGDPYVNSAVVWATLHGLAKLTIEKQVPKLVDPKERQEVIARAVVVLTRGLS